MRRDAPDHSRLLDTEHLKQGIGRTSRNAAVASMGAQAMRFVLSLGALAALARLITPEEAGIFAKVWAVVGFVGLFKDAGLSMATIQRDQITQDQVSTLFWINVAFSAALALIGLALSPVIAAFFGQDQLVWLAAAMSSLFLLGGLVAQPQALLRRQMKFGTLAICQIISMVLSVAAAIVVAAYLGKTGAGYWALFVQQAVMQATQLALIWGVARWKPGPPRRGAGTRTMFAFGVYLTGTNVAFYVGNNIANLLIGKYVGDAAAGQYDRAYRLLMLPVQRVLFPLETIGVGAFSRIGDDAHRFNAAYIKILAIGTAIMAPGAAYAAVCSDWLVRVALGPQWDEAGRLFGILGIFCAFQPLLATCQWVMVSKGRTRRLFWIVLCNNAVTVAAIAATVQHGVTAVAIAYVASALVLRVPFMVWGARSCSSLNTKHFSNGTWPFVLASTTAAGATYAFRHAIPDPGPWLGLVLTAAIFGVVYAALVFAIPRGRAVIGMLRTLRQQPGPAPADGDERADQDNLHETNAIEPTREPEKPE